MKFAFRPLAVTAAAVLLLSAGLPAKAQSFDQLGANSTTGNPSGLPFIGSPTSLNFGTDTIYIANSAPGSFSALSGAQLTAGALSIANGGVAIVPGNPVTVGSLGEVTFDGINPTSGIRTTVNLGGSGNRLEVGNWGTGTLTVSGGALLDASVNPGACINCANFIGNGAGSTGTLTVTGTGSEVKAIGGFYVGHSSVFIGPPTTFGTPGGTTNAFVNVLAGAKLTTGWAQVANNNGTPNGNGSEKANATVLIDGANSEWTVGRSGNQPARLNIGNTAGSTGIVTVSGGGKLRIDNGVNPGGANQEPGTIVGVAGKGTLIITGTGSTLDNSNMGGFINVGQAAGGDGSFQVLAGASATSTFLNLGRNAGANGSMLIDGANSMLTLSGVSTMPGQTSTAGANIGRNGGEGTATVSNGGYWLITDGGQDGRSINGSPSLSVGRDNNSKGLLTITGANSKVEIIGNSLGLAPGVPDNNNPFVNIGRENAGGANQGELMISAGGKLVLTGNAVSTQTNGRATLLSIGGRGGFAAKGTATVTGVGSEIIVQGYDAVINVGREAGGIGSLNVLAGGKVSSTSMAVGISGQGTVTIDGGTIALSGDRSDSSLVGAGMTVGRGTGGVGLLNMSNGAVLSFSPVLLGGGMAIGGDQFLTGGSGTVNMSGGSTITILSGSSPSNGMSIGRSGTGTLVASGSSAIDLGLTGGIDFGRDVGGNGSMVLNSGSTFRNNSASIGGASDSVGGGTGNVTVTGLGSEFISSGASGFIGVGRGGTGTLSVLDQGKVSAIALSVGRSTGGNGQLTVNNGIVNLAGQQTSGNQVGASMGVGLGGATGNASFANGSQLNITNLGSAGASLGIGGNSLFPGGTGTLSVAGASQIKVTAATGAQANMNIGRDGTGTANLSAGSSVSVGSEVATVYSANGNVYVGRDAGGVGVLNMSGGSVVNAGFVGIGVSAAGTGNALNAAPHGTGTLVLNNSTINTSRFELGAGSLLTGDGGVINAGPSGPVIIGGTISPGNSPGRLRINCDVTMLAGSQLILEINDRDGGPGVDFDIDQLIIGSDSKFDLDSIQIIFSFIGNTNPNEFANSEGGFNLDRFLLAGGAGNTIAGGLSDLFGNARNPDITDWGQAVNSNLFAFESSAFDVSKMSFDAETGRVVISASAIPEPASMALVVLALGAMLMASRRRPARRGC